MHPIEIERRFLLANNSWRQMAGSPQILYQGYLSVEKERTIRVRICNGEAWLTLKSSLSDVSRLEFEYPVPLAHAHSMMENMCLFTLKKRRYKIDFGGFTYEIDEFEGDNAPLVLAELELPHEQTPFDRPDWLGTEITSDPRFTNAYLSKHPYSTWPQAFQAA